MDTHTFTEQSIVDLGKLSDKGVEALHAWCASRLGTPVKLNKFDKFDKFRVWLKAVLVPNDTEVVLFGKTYVFVGWKDDSNIVVCDDLRGRGWTGGHNRTEFVAPTINVSAVILEGVPFPIETVFK